MRGKTGGASEVDLILGGTYAFVTLMRALSHKLKSALKPTSCTGETRWILNTSKSGFLVKRAVRWVVKRMEGLNSEASLVQKMIFIQKILLEIVTLLHFPDYLHLSSFLNFCWLRVHHKYLFLPQGRITISVDRVMMIVFVHRIGDFLYQWT